MLDALLRAMTYFPSPGPVGPASRYAAGARDVVLTTADGLRLGAWCFPPASADGRGGACGPGPRPDPDRKIALLFLPGNGGDREGRYPLFLALARRGFTVLAVDYRGYGGNPGVPSEGGLAADARAGVAWLRAEGFAPERTLYVGESLGTAVAARLATTDPPAGLLLRSPFPSLVAVAKHHYGFLPVERLMTDRFAAAEHLAACPVPVVVLRGAADGIVPNVLSANLAHGVPHLLADVEVPGADHNDALWYGDFLADAVVRLAEAAVPGSA